MPVSAEMNSRLGAPAWYRPYAAGRYSVGPGLKRFGHDFGNGPADEQVFQLDQQFAPYHENKVAARSELRRYFGTRECPRETAQAVYGFIVARLTSEHPGLFVKAGTRLHCGLTGDLIETGHEKSDLDTALDLLGMQVQEDFCVMSLAAERNWTCLVHVMAPNYWRPEQILGADYGEVHGPVPGMERLKSKTSRMLESIAAGAHYIRFVWGLETDDRLNHHPDVSGASDRARAWAVAPPEARRLFVRVERQVLAGLPEVSSLFFGIRTYIRDVTGLPATDRLALAQAVRGMNEVERAYKGLTGCAEDFIAYLSTI